MIEFFFAFFVALFAGFIGSMVGVGGGIINSPFLIYLNYTPSQISSTSLIAVFSTSISSTTQYLRKRLVDYRVGLVLALSSLPGTIIGVIGSSFISLEQFRFYFGVILSCTALYLLLRKNLINSRKDYEPVDVESKTRAKIVILIVFSFFAGIISSIFGVGGGIIYVPCLIILMKFSVKSSTATSQFALLFTSISGVFFFALQGRPDYSMGLVLSAGSLIGGTFGSMMALKMDSLIILKLFSLLLLLVSAKIFYDGFV